MGSYKCCTSSAAESTQIDTLASLLKIVAEPNRLRLLCILQAGEHCVCEIERHLQLSQSLISHHLKDLKDAGVVLDEKRGLYVYYSLTKEGHWMTKILFKLKEKTI